MDYLSVYDPADVPPSPRAFVQYEENRRKETGESFNDGIIAYSSFI